MIEGTIEQIKSDRNWEKVEPWKKGIVLGEICLYTAFHLRRPFSLHSTGISGIGAESLDFTGLKGQSAGFRDAKAAEKCEDNSRKKKKTGERTPKSEHKHHSISCLNTYLCRCKVDFMCKVDFKDFSKKQQLEDKTTTTTTSWEKISAAAPFEREYGFVSSQDYCFLKQTNKNRHFFLELDITESTVLRCIFHDIHCYGRNCVPPNSYVPQNVIVFGDRTFKEAINLKSVHYGGP